MRSSESRTLPLDTKRSFASLKSKILFQSTESPSSNPRDLVSTSSCPIEAQAQAQTASSSLDSRSQPTVSTSSFVVSELPSKYNLLENPRFFDSIQEPEDIRFLSVNGVQLDPYTLFPISESSMAKTQVDNESPFGQESISTSGKNKALPLVPVAIESIDDYVVVNKSRTGNNDCRRGPVIHFDEEAEEVIMGTTPTKERADLARLRNTSLTSPTKYLPPGRTVTKKVSATVMNKPSSNLGSPVHSPSHPPRSSSLPFSSAAATPPSLTTPRTPTTSAISSPQGVSSPLFERLSRPTAVSAAREAEAKAKIQARKTSGAMASIKGVASRMKSIMPNGRNVSSGTGGKGRIDIRKISSPVLGSGVILESTSVFMTTALPSNNAANTEEAKLSSPEIEEINSNNNSLNVSKFDANEATLVNSLITDDTPGVEEMGPKFANNHVTPLTKYIPHLTVAQISNAYLDLTSETSPNMVLEAEFQKLKQKFNLIVHTADTSNNVQLKRRIMLEYASMAGGLMDLKLDQIRLAAKAEEYMENANDIFNQVKEVTEKMNDMIELVQAETPEGNA